MIRKHWSFCVVIGAVWLAVVIGGCSWVWQRWNTPEPAAAIPAAVDTGGNPGQP